MTGKPIELRGVRKRYRFFTLDDVSLDLGAGEILGLVGPNGAGKSTTIRILMGLVDADAGDVRVLSHAMPQAQAIAKRDIGFVSDEMRLYAHATLGWHMQFVASIYPGWDDAYAGQLLQRFNLRREQPVRGLSHGEHVKALLLLALARRPQLLVLDEPTAGLDPVARHEVLTELTDAMRDEHRAILFSSHHTLDVERISDRITFIDRGRVVASSDKETFLDDWRRIVVATATPERATSLADGPADHTLDHIVERAVDGHFVTLTTDRFTPALLERLTAAGARVDRVQRMSLEEIFVANVMRHRQGRES